MVICINLWTACETSSLPGNQPLYQIFSPKCKASVLLAGRAPYVATQQYRLYTKGEVKTKGH